MEMVNNVRDKDYDRKLAILAFFSLSLKKSKKFFNEKYIIDNLIDSFKDVEVTLKIKKGWYYITEKDEDIIKKLKESFKNSGHF